MMYMYFYLPAQMEMFIEFLCERGAVMKELTNEWEVCRFKANGQTSVVYKNKRDEMKFTHGAHIPWEAFIEGKDWVNAQQLDLPIPEADPPEHYRTVGEHYVETTDDGTLPWAAPEYRIAIGDERPVAYLQSAMGPRIGLTKLQ